MVHSILASLESHAGYVLLIAGAATCFIATVRVVDASKFKFEPRPRVHWLTLSLGMLFLVSSIPLYLYADRLHPYTNLEGRWFYQVRNNAAEFSHQGDCTIKQAGSQLEISGVRRYTCDSSGGTCKIVVSNAPWKSTWAQICHDHTIRFEYQISPQNEILNGFCKLDYTKNPREELNGKYSLLPPFPTETPNARDGYITFRRLEDDEVAPAPTEADLAKPLKSF